MSNYETYQGRVTKKLPNDQYMVREAGADDDQRCVAKGSLKNNRISIVVGDTVQVERIPNSNFHRIYWRGKK